MIFTGMIFHLLLFYLHCAQVKCYLQVYPTTIRALGLGICSGMARIGALVTPFVAQVSQMFFDLVVAMSVDHDIVMTRKEI